MLRLLLAGLLCASLPASASDGEEEPGRAAGRARRLIESQSLPARAELRRMYRRYADAVATRLERGWRAGLLDEALISGGDEPFSPARLVEDMIRARKKEIADLRAALAASDPQKPGYGRDRRLLTTKLGELSDLRAKATRDKGLCRDWSDLVWHELTDMGLEHWTVRDETRRARPLHTAAVVCSAEEPTVCLAFDPWEDGKADVFAYEAWNEKALGGRFPREYMLHALPEKE